MGTLLDFMMADHARLDGIFKEFDKLKSDNLTGAKPFFQKFKLGLERHILWEEGILFPIFEEKTGMSDGGPTAVMRMEHHEIKDFLEKINSEILTGELEEIDIAKNGLLDVLHTHNQKEESILYPSIDNMLTDQEREKAISDMNNMPSA